jgi:hypothetical protein
MSNIDRKDVIIERHPIFLSDRTLALITLFNIESKATIYDMFALDYIDARKEQGNAAEQIIESLNDYLSINFLWALKEACDKKIVERNKFLKEAGLMHNHPLNRPKGDA